MTTCAWSRLGLVALVSGCAVSTHPAPVVQDRPSALASPQCDDETALPTVTRSPGGTPEVSPTALAAAHCRVRVIDVRAKSEIADSGIIAGSEHIPLEHVANHAQGWDRTEPVVFVCRSGRRSGVAARELAEMGFEHVSSLTGGVLAWQDSGRRLSPYYEHPEAPVPAAHRHALSAEDIREHVADRDHVRFAKAATLLLHGTQACVDGRDAHAIIGTPGGDAGELVLALATAEQLGHEPFSEDAVDRVFGHYLDAFGHFYLHTDGHAAQRWLGHVGLSFEDQEEVESLLQAPPEPYRARLLDAVAEPSHVGCGHLRLSLQHAEDYGVRARLVRDVLRAYFRRLWQGDPRLEFVVLEGEHAESAIVSIEMERKVHAYTQIPLVSPRVRDTEVFVIHPQVSAFIREQNSAFLLEEVPSITASGTTEQEFVQAQQRLAQRQLQESVRHLGPDLPVFVVSVNGETITVADAQPPQFDETPTESGQ